MTRILLVTFFFTVKNAWGLSWSEFLVTSRTHSPEIRQVELRYQEVNLPIAEVESDLDWKITLEHGLTRDRRVSLSDLNFDLEKTLETSLSAVTSFRSGTDVSMTLLSQKSSFRPDPSENGYFLSSSFRLEQNLWKNAFGSAIRAELRGAEQKSRLQEMEMKEEIEKTLFSGSQIFWKTAVAERRLLQSQATVERYRNLVKNIEKKNQNRYAAPGELAQVTAEFYNREQQARTNQIQFTTLKNSLQLFLPSFHFENLTWKETTPDEKSLFTLGSDILPQTRSYKMAELRRGALRETSKAAQSESRSQLALVGEVISTGADSSNSAAENVMSEGRRPSTYVGMKWSYSFGSDLLDKRARQAKAFDQAGQLKFQTELEELKLNFERLQKAVLALKENLKFQDQQLGFRKKAVQDLTKSFNQGRIDIGILIDAINKAEEAEVQQVQVRSDLELTLLELKLMLDQVPL